MKSMMNRKRGDKTDFKFEKYFNIIQKRVHNVAKEHGFWDDNGYKHHGTTLRFGESIALIHSEISECLEAYRNGPSVSKKIPNYSGVEEELADTIIRIMDMAQACNLDVCGAIIEKTEYNKGRLNKHGKKF